MTSNPPKPPTPDRAGDKHPALSALFSRLAAAAPPRPPDPPPRPPDPAPPPAAPEPPSASPAPWPASPPSPPAASAPPPAPPPAAAAPPRPPDPAPPPASPAPPPPSWLLRPVVALGIPDTPLGRGNGAVPAFEPQMIGFSEPDPPAPEAPDAVLPVEIDLSELDPPAASRGNGALPLRRSERPAAPRPRPAPLRPLPLPPRRPAARPEMPAASDGIGADSPLAGLAARLGRGTGKTARRSLPPEPRRPPPASRRPPPAGPPPGPRQARPESALVALRRPPPASPVAVPETRPLAQNRRLYRRVMLTAELEVDGVPCRLIDLSIGGFAAAGAGPLTPNTVVTVALRMTIDGIDIGTQFGARIVYASEARSAGRFVDLTAAQTAFLRYVVTWRGESVGASGTTALLDAVTRSPERAFPPHPSTEPAPPERQSWWQRWFGRIPLLGRRRDQ